MQRALIELSEENHLNLLYSIHYINTGIPTFPPTVFNHSMWIKLIQGLYLPGKDRKAGK